MPQTDSKEAKGTRRRRALILVNETFENKSLNRVGAQWDLIKMNTLFTASGFLVTAYKDLKAAEMTAKLTMFVRKASQVLELDCLAVVISSHGRENTERFTGGAQGDPRLGQQVVEIRQSVLGTDGNELILEDIFKLFGQEPNLENKPKLFFIQACRSRLSTSPGLEPFDSGVPITIKLIEMPTQAGSQPTDVWRHNDNTLRQLVLEKYPRQDSPEKDEWRDENKDPALPATTEVQSETRGNEPVEGETSANQGVYPDTDPVPSLPSYTSSTMTQRRARYVPPIPDCEIVVSKLPKNCLVVSSATVGRVSYRDTLVGSLMYHFMYKHASRLLGGENILRFMTFVAGRVAELDIETGGKIFKACISSHHRLCQNVSFGGEETRSLLSQLQQRTGE